MNHEAFFVIMYIFNAIVYPWPNRRRLRETESDRLTKCPTCEYAMNWVENVSDCPECGTRTQRIPLEAPKKKTRYYSILVWLLAPAIPTAAITMLGHLAVQHNIPTTPFIELWALPIGLLIGPTYMWFVCGKPRFSETISYRIVWRRKDQVDPAPLIRRRHRAEVEE